MAGSEFERRRVTPALRVEQGDRGKSVLRPHAESRPKERDGRPFAAQEVLKGLLAAASVGVVQGP
jgi:hypothetical protein